MTEEQKKIFRNIIYAVETGGNVYGQMDYSSFKEAKEGAETALTIGAGQWYANNARELLRFIRDTDLGLFASLDTAGIGSSLANDWSHYNEKEGSAKARCIQQMISTSVGMQCQDELMDQKLEIYINQAAGWGVTYLDAQMMCANFTHHGHDTATTRILKKTTKPYTLDKLFESTKSDTGNQVGTYKLRQKMVYESLKQYISPYMNVEKRPVAELAVEKVIRIAEAEVGYLEKADNKDLYDKTANSGKANYTKYWEDIIKSYQGYAWCAAFITWVFQQAFGRETATLMLQVKYPWTYVNNMKNYAQSCIPHVGDLVLYWKKYEDPEDGPDRYGHAGIVVAVEDGDIFYTIEGNTSGTAELENEVVAEGQGVFRKKRSIKDTSAIKPTLFFTPDYSLAGESDIVHKSGWSAENNGWRFYLGNRGEYIQNNWYQDGELWYWFDGDGMMIYDTWYSDKGEWYWFDASGRMLCSEWHQYKRQWYYLTASGAMAKNQWVMAKDKLYRLGEDGIMVTNPMELASDERGALQIGGNGTNVAWYDRMKILHWPGKVFKK